MLGKRLLGIDQSLMVDMRLLGMAHLVGKRLMIDMKLVLVGEMVDMRLLLLVDKRLMVDMSLFGIVLVGKNLMVNTRLPGT